MDQMQHLNLSQVVARQRLLNSIKPGEFIDRAVWLARIQIGTDMALGTVPKDCPNFAALHDYVDANEYGGLCEDAVIERAHLLMPKCEGEDDEVLGSQAFCYACNLIQHELDRLLRRGFINAL